MSQKYFTIVIRADDEKAARSLVPGEIIKGNPIVSCGLGDVMSLADKFKELIPADKESEVSKLENEDLQAFFPKT